MTMQICGWILMQMQRGAGKAGTGALPSHSHLESALHSLLAPAGSRDLLGWLAEGQKVPVDHGGSSQEEEMDLGRVISPSQHGSCGCWR